MSRQSSLRELLRQQLLAARQLDEQTTADNAAGERLDVPSAGTLLSSAYEQLRNAAEYAEEHLLLQRAIKRFCKRNLFLHKRRADGLGADLLAELVQAGYLHRESAGRDTARRLDRLFDDYLAAYNQLRRSDAGRDTAEAWTLPLLACGAESLLSPHHTQRAVIFFAYEYFRRAIPQEEFAELPGSDAFEFCLYIAVQQALLKSDEDVVRYELFGLYRQSPKDTAGFVYLNQQIDRLYGSPLTQQLKRVVSRHGAPFRILKALTDDRPDTTELLADRQRFMEAYGRQTTFEFQQLDHRLYRRLIKSILFIFITKVLIGVAVEVPYDLFRQGTVSLLPLGVNLLFPPLYMASLKSTIRLPTAADGRAARSCMERILFDDVEPPVHAAPQRRASPGAKVLYTLLFVVPMVITVLLLQRIGFNVVQMIIFFIFFSTASYLGFRLSTLVRELEMTRRRTSGLLASLRDFFYLPFIVFGQWLSREYSQINALARFLDIAVELPLKAVLKLLRQWIRFINDTQEDLY